MSSNLKRPDSDATEKWSIDQAEGLRHFNRTPRPYFHDGLEVRQNQYHVYDEHGVGGSHVVPEQGRYCPPEVSEQWQGRNGQGSVAHSESGTEADDERPTFVKALPPANLRPRKGLKTGEKNEDVLLTPSQLDDEGRRLSQGYFKPKGSGNKIAEEERAEQEKLLRIRLGEFIRRTSEVALMGLILVCVLCGNGVLQTARQWWRELASHVVIVAILVLAYPVKLSIVDTRAQHTKVWERFRVPASFDPATVLYPPLLPVLVALSVCPGNQGVILPNIILGLASLPQRLFPRSSRLGGINAVHWLVSVIPLILSENGYSAFSEQPEKPYLLKSGPAHGLGSEALVSLYPLHHALLSPLQYLTTTSLLISELHLLSVALTNLLLLAVSPQTLILKACLWVGGVSVFVLCGPVLHWNVALARVPKWKLRRPGHSAKERKSFVDAVSDLVNLQRAIAALRGSEAEDSDADEGEPRTSTIETANGVPWVFPKVPSWYLSTSEHHEPKSAEPRHIAPIDSVSREKSEYSRAWRNTLPGRPTLVSAREVSSRRKPRSKMLWCLQLTPQQAARRKSLYAIYVLLAIAAVALGPVRIYVQNKALQGIDPFGWAVSYLFGQIPMVRSIVKQLSLDTWAPLPLAAGSWRNVRLSVPLSIPSMRLELGLANVRLLLFAYWIAVIAAGLLAVFSLTASVEVDTRRKVFHGVMVAVLAPSVFVDPLYCALGLAIVLAVFLLLEVIRAGQVPPLGSAIGRFVAPYVDGRDLCGPVVVSHIFLLVGCAVPLWFSLASIEREGDKPWINWELASNQREVAMIAGVICVGMGDAAASLVGRRYGRHKWIWVGGKSVEGSAAFAAAVTVGLVAGKVWQASGGWNDTVEPLQEYLGGKGIAQFAVAWTVVLVKAVFCACGASFMEAVLTGANDNVVVPVALWLLVKGTQL